MTSFKSFARLLALFSCACLLIALPAGAEAPADALQGMSLEEKVAQLFLVRAAGGEEDLVSEYRVGGLIFFADYFKNKEPEDVRGAFSDLQKMSGIPLLIAVDEEGGTVTRISRFSQYGRDKFLSPAALFAAGGMSEIVEDAKEKSRFLLDLGVNFNLAPVVDVSLSAADYMHSRSLGEDAETTALYASAVVTAMNNEGILSAMKHFPGYGDNADTHSGIAIDKRSLDSFREKDFLPFSAGIRSGAGCILVSHNVMRSVDKNRPASLSPAVHRLLREELGFEGVIMTDDLKMQAIQEYTDVGTSAVMAIEAGNDLLCCSNFKTQYAALLKAVKAGTISEERIDESVLRILKWKEGIGVAR